MIKIDKLGIHFFIVLIQITLLICVYTYIISPKNFYIDHKNIATIKKNMGKLVNSCGSGYFASWLVMETSRKKENFIFEDVIGCNYNHAKDCVFSVKDLNLNPFYNKMEHKIDKKTYNFLSNIPDGEVAYFKDIKELEPYKTIENIIDNTNLPITNVSFTVIKNRKENIIYVFTLTNTNNSNLCNQKKSTILLKRLAKTTREIIF
jgi:hypothetical protein